MRRCLRRRRRLANVEVVDVTQAAGMTARARRSAALPAVDDLGLSPKRRVDGLKGGELQSSSYLQRRSRNLVLAHRLSKSATDYQVSCCGSVDRGRISRCSSISSCEPAAEDELPIPDASGQKPCEDCVSSIRDFDCSKNRVDMLLSDNEIVYLGELESTAERKIQQPTTQFMSPPAMEIEVFFAAAEKLEKQRFRTKYNFDVEKELPLEGRYEWVQMIP